MKLSDLNELAWQNLREAFLRNSLTTVGIGVGVASLVAMLSLGIGLQDMINRRLERGGLFDSILVRRRVEIVRPGEQARNRLIGRPTTPQVPAAPLDAAAREKISRIPNVLEAYPEVRFTGDMRFGDEGRLTDISSLPPSASSNDAFEGMQGHFFSAPDAHEIILQMDT